MLSILPAGIEDVLAFDVAFVSRSAADAMIISARYRSE